MKAIVSLNNLDFHGLAILAAAKKFHPGAIAVLPPIYQHAVKRFLDDYKTDFSFQHDGELSWNEVDEIVFVDWEDEKQESLYRSLPASAAKTNFWRTIKATKRGVPITSLIYEIKRKQIPVTAIEATLFALGLYSSTNHLTLPSTTASDADACAYLLEKGADLRVVNDYLQQTPMAEKIASVMSKPVVTVQASQLVEEVWQTLLRSGHSGFPVVDETGALAGVITRMDLAKARQFGMGEAQVTEVMSAPITTLRANDSIDAACAHLAYNQVGRLPVVGDNNEPIGIVTRTDIVRLLYPNKHAVAPSELASYFGKQTFSFLQKIGAFADELQVPVYLVGGLVRDFLLKRPHKDIDLVIEGDGIAFAKQLATAFGGSVRSHESFGTATWVNEQEMDIVTCRKEFYLQKGALPTVRPASIYEDLARRDFSINAMAIQINRSSFGNVLDVFQGKQALIDKHIRILHPLSFIEDPTRLFRAVRFGLRLNFSLSFETLHQATKTGAALHHISAKRLRQELDLLANEGVLLEGFRQLADLHVWTTLFGSPFSKRAWQHLANLQQHGLNDGMFFLLAGAVDCDRLDVASRYALTKQEKRLTEEASLPIWQQMSATSSIGEAHRDLAQISSEIVRFYSEAELPLSPLLRRYAEKRRQLEPLLTGADLLKAGYRPGPSFSQWLLEIECLQLDGRINTKDQALAWIAEKT
ncbi:CBS domain-containing protein [Shouchella clausii]|uniref:CBS domain-containing protein n=1 Tax=Shouchella clausii TaxID=79880 RepID=UPI000BA6D907|nr:CBS domain-containing protein [Shouchella clausii]MEB5480966.1 CBS domain-containing protein [Shouchella clausii]PAD43104.1 hypothetical protein CHH54_08810 [Bacillus sp. 7520-S]PTL24950.1 CBS domain-containing protein [Shouchella clausii]